MLIDSVHGEPSLTSAGSAPVAQPAEVIHFFVKHTQANQRHGY